METRIGLNGEIEIGKGGPGSGPHSKGSFVKDPNGKTGKIVTRVDSKGKVGVHYPGQMYQIHHTSNLSPSTQKEYMQNSYFKK